MAVYILTIAGTEQRIKLGSLNFQGVVNGRNTFSCIVLSDPSAPYRPALGAEAVISEDGTDIVGGYIDRTEEQGDDGQVLPEFMTEIVCVSFDVLADRRFVTATFVAGTTLKAVLTALAAYVTVYGASLNAGQVTGPSLTEDLILDGELLKDVFNKLSALTGYLWAFAPDKTFSMFAVGTVAAPFNIVDTDLPAKYVGDIRVIRSREKYVNRVVAKIGTAVAVEKTETFIGNGVLTTFPLTYTLIYTPVVGRGYVTHNGVYQTLGLTNAHWIIDTAANALVYTPAENDVPAVVPNSDVVAITFDAQFPMPVVAEDAAEILANGLSEAVFSFPNVYDVPTGQLLAAAQLSKGLSIKTEVQYQTFEIGLLEGMTQTLTHADRNVTGSFLLTEVKAANPSNTQELLRSVVAVGGSQFLGSYRDLIQAWLGGGSSSAGTGPATSLGGSSPALPLRSVQFHDPDKPGQLGGTVDVLLDKDGTGQSYGRRARLAVVLDDDNSIDALTIANRTGGLTHGLRLAATDDGGALLYLNAGGSSTYGMHLYSSGNGYFETGQGLVLAPGLAGSGWGVSVIGNAWMDTLFTSVWVVTTTPYTIDAYASGGSPPNDARSECTILWNRSSAGTVNLTTIGSLSAPHNFVSAGSGGKGRIVVVKNVGTAVCTIDPASSEKIFLGATALTTLDVQPGQGVMLQVFYAAGALDGWHVIASTGTAWPGTVQIQTALVTLTNAQIKAWPTTPVQMVVAAGSGVRIKPLSLTLLMSVATPYANVNTTYADLKLQTDNGDWLSSPILNDNSITSNPTRMTALLASAAHDSVVDFLFPYVDTGGDLWSPQPLVNIGYGGAVNQGLRVAFDNDGAGDLTGGGVGNFGKLNLAYMLEAL